MEKLNPNVIALSLGTTAVAVYVFCVILIAILSLQVIITISNTLMHGIDVSSIATKNITTISTLTGFALSFIGAAVIGYIFTFIYNFFAEKFE